MEVLITQLNHDVLNDMRVSILLQKKSLEAAFLKLHLNSRIRPPRAREIIVADLFTEVYCSFTFFAIYNWT